MKFRKFLRKFIKVEYRDGRVHPYLRFQIKINIKFPFSFKSRRAYNWLYGKNEIVPNKIVCDNYMGKPFGCNSKYVVNKLLEKYPDELDIVWTATKKEMKSKSYPEGVRVVKYGAVAAKKEYSSAKVWLTNYHKVSYAKQGMYRKDGQYYIQMWHGSLGIKKIENNVSCLTENATWLQFAQESSRMTTHWISNSAFETNIYKTAFWDAENILEYGHPRNDLLINQDPEIINKVKEYYDITDKKILFYAPTFREDYRLDCYQIDYAALKEALEEKFGGEWVFVVRLHPRVGKFASTLLPKEDYIVNATYYPDIQELLLSADCMISDYSSCIFDFLLTRRPAFIFATDIEEYNTERGFYYPLESTPFPIALDNESLINNVHSFNSESYAVKAQEFLDSKGCIEDGNASERVADLIMELVRS